MAGAGPDLVAFIPRYITAAVRADTADRVKFTFAIAINCDVLTRENYAVILRYVIQIDR